MPKWKKDAKAFTVNINHYDKRGFQSSIPIPVMEVLGNPDKITFVVKPKKRVEIVAGSAEAGEKSEGE